MVCEEAAAASWTCRGTATVGAGNRDIQGYGFVKNIRQNIDQKVQYRYNLYFRNFEQRNARSLTTGSMALLALLVIRLRLAY